MHSLLQPGEKIDELVRGYFGFDEVTIGLTFDVSADFFTLLDIGRDDNAGMETWSQAFVAECAQNLDSGDGWNHEVKQYYVVLVCLRGGETFLAVAHSVN